MFEATDTQDLLREIRAYDFDSDPVHEWGANRVDAIAALDRSIRSAQAEQAAQIAALYADRLPMMGIGRGAPELSVIGEVSMARNISPGAAGTQFSLAIGMTQIPRIAELFAAGLISEPVARAVVKESAALCPDDLAVLDGELATRLVGLTAFRAAMLTRHHVIRIDVEAARARAAANRADRRVSMFPETDGVAILHVRGPAEQIVATYNSLDSWAQGLRASGDERSTGEIMCHTLVERVTGLAHADEINVEVGLVMDAKTLIADGDEPVELDGYGPISPDVADEIIARAPNRSIRRLLTDPIDGTLLVREPRRRRFDMPTAAHIRTRDRRCRQPGCDGTIRDNDHIHAHQNGGLSIKENGQGLCPRSHTLKHQPGWKVVPDGKATIWTTPTGHTYRSDPPPLLPRNNPGHLRQ